MLSEIETTAKNGFDHIFARHCPLATGLAIIGFC